MAEKTKTWATHIFNPWFGFRQASEGGTRRRTADSTWRQVERLNRRAACYWRTGSCADGHLCSCPQHNRPRVFPSACDPFEDWDGPICGPDRRVWIQHESGERYLVPASGHEDGHGPRLLRLSDVRHDFFGLVDRCPNLDFPLGTKRPENVRRMWSGSCVPGGMAAIVDRTIRDVRDPCKRFDIYRGNVWLLCSASDQRSLDAGLPHLLACRDLVPVLGLSLDPLVGPVDLRSWITPLLTGERAGQRLIDWVIVGGESGPHARPCEVAWIRSIVDQCRAAGVACFVKQDSGRSPGRQGRIPDDLWGVKELPKP